ncbi:type II toxin-antitoxin system VapC family toxin [Noviherbaspirillum pedocola]|uniref:Type II toxin-antitoxin system VapC family toxin n=1 Tax=Noviherbaspirillum pedocola TaxID=2801341 RepID=A0A934SX80_9BURK|nr:type II toxin-antitoxin system VapC family toxin [Noviherbaspirillum pedocola]MBK4737148.1 type II toxin-antitoxin system VapC family toxin [Noviherbaspirillum pedocola]
MDLLLDTHVYLWWLIDDPQLSPRARSCIGRAKRVFVSSASIWEASIKVGIGKLEADINHMVREIKANGFIALPVNIAHAARVVELPDIHRDPFDRILIAQSMVENVQLLSTDRLLCRYTDLVLTV